MDNLYIGGSVANCPHRLVDDHFDTVSDSWLFHPGGSLQEFCQPQHEDIYSDEASR